jgi:hypothetical protein
MAESASTVFPRSSLANQRPVLAIVVVGLIAGVLDLGRFAGPEPQRAVYYPEDDRYFPEEQRTPYVRHYEVGGTR